MKKIVSNTLIVVTQLIVGVLFLFILFSGKDDNTKVVVIENNNLNKMSDAVNELFIVENAILEQPIDVTSEEVLVSAEEEALRKAAEEEAARKAAEEEAARRAAEEEALRKAAEEEAARNAVVVDAGGYISKPGKGFEVTTGNKTYTLTEEEFAILAGVVNCEANKNSKDDVLGVISVILNRADSARYPNDPVSVVAAPSQFSCYKGVANYNVSESVKTVIRDALNGVRNNKYYGFRSWQSTGYSNNYIVENGNRYN